MTHDLLKQAQAAVKAGTVKAHDKEGGGDFEYTPPAAGLCYGRFVGYVEFGNHAQRAYQGKDKPPAREAVAMFQLLGKKHKIEYKDNDGNTQVRYPIVRANLTVKGGPRAGYTKLLNAMDYGRGIDAMPLMLGEAFRINIIHNEVEKDGKKTVYANIKADGVWQVSAPVRDQEDEDGEIVQVPVKVPEAPETLKMFLWDAPTIEMWNSIHIEGTYTKKVGEKEEEISKNWMQQKCMEALDFEGSGLQLLLAEASGDLPDLGDIDGDDGTASEDEEGPSGGKGSQGGKNPTENGGGSPDEGDPLAGLDLDDEIEA